MTAYQPIMQPTSLPANFAMAKAKVKVESNLTRFEAVNHGLFDENRSSLAEVYRLAVSEGFLERNELLTYLQKSSLEQAESTDKLMGDIETAFRSELDLKAVDVLLDLNDRVGVYAYVGSNTLFDFPVKSPVHKLAYLYARYVTENYMGHFSELLDWRLDGFREEMCWCLGLNLDEKTLELVFENGETAETDGTLLKMLGDGCFDEHVDEAGYERGDAEGQIHQFEELKTYRAKLEEIQADAPDFKNENTIFEQLDALKLPENEHQQWHVFFSKLRDAKAVIQSHSESLVEAGELQFMSGGLLAPSFLCENLGYDIIEEHFQGIMEGGESCALRVPVTTETTKIIKALDTLYCVTSDMINIIE